MECDLGRLQIAIEAARKRIEGDWRQRYRIAGYKVDEPAYEPDSDAAFNDQIRGTIALMQQSFSAK